MRTDPKRVQAVFLAAVEAGDPAARADILGRECGPDLEFRRRVEALLAAHDAPGSLLDQPAVSPPTGGEEVVGSRAPVPNPDDTQGDPQNDGEAQALGFLQPSTKPGSLGRLGHYEVLEVLGRGGFGIVLKAFDDMLHRVVAIKVMAAHLASTSPARKRFLREARAAAAVRHENVVAIHAVEEQPVPYLVMEYIAGRTLQERLDDTGPREVAEVLRLGHQIARGLAAAHARGLIHRDIKPANILLEAGVEQQIKITDFGLARAADDASLTQSGLIAGTPMYMAPEQAQGEVIDQRADLFSLGSVLYVMCSGRPPFRASTTMGVLKRVAEDTPRPIREIIPEVPEWLCAIVARLHAKDPADRFASAKEVADLLARYSAELQAHGGVIPIDAERAAGASPEIVPRRHDAPRPMKRRWTVAVALTLLGVTVGTILYLNDFKGTVPVRVIENPNGQPLVGVGKPPPVAIAPFDGEKAKAHQDAWAKHLGVGVETTNSIGMKLRLIPPGEFPMTPDYHVTISKPFRMGIHEVTIAQFRAFADELRYKTAAEVSGGGIAKHSDGRIEKGPEFTWRHKDVSRGDDYPVGQLCWNDAVKFCEWLSGPFHK